MKPLFLCLLTFFVFSFAAKGQGVVSFSSDAKISKMMDRFIEINKATTTIDGWRIQLLASTDRQKVESAKFQFQSFYPNISVDWTHSRPYYKLRAGAFATKLDAIRMLYVLKQDYPTAYPTRDNTIRPEELVPGL